MASRFAYSLVRKVDTPNVPRSAELADAEHIAYHAHDVTCPAMSLRMRKALYLGNVTGSNLLVDIPAGEGAAVAAPAPAPAPARSSAAEAAPTVAAPADENLLNMEVRLALLP
jgi:hypothetical protein